MKRIANDFTDALKERIESGTVISTEDAISEIEPYYSFDVDALKQAELRRIVGRVARRVTDGKGNRTAYLIQKKGVIVNVENCRDPDLMAEVMEQMQRQYDGCLRSIRHVKRRIKVISGQMRMFDLLEKTGTE